MTKRQALNLLGNGTENQAAKRLGISRQAVAVWMDPLTQNLTDRIIGFCVRKGIWPGFDRLGPK